MGKFSGKRALVTGGSIGIGRGVALKLAELGAEVFVMARNEEALKSLEAENPRIKSIALDVTDWAKTREEVQNVTPIHLLVNNAAYNFLNPALEATSEEFDYMFNLNVKSAMNTTQVVAKDLVKRKEGGKVVNVSSVGAEKAVENHLIYCSTKGALDMMTKGFALELAPHNIRVNSVNPTVVMTAMGKRAWSDPAKATPMLKRIPQGKFAEVEDVANAVVFLLSDESDMINGHSLFVDGGFLTN